jgi:hypothetical protein
LPPDSGSLTIGASGTRENLDYFAIRVAKMKKVTDEPAVPIDIIGAPGRIRTCGTRIRNPVLYPLSYGGIVVEERRFLPAPSPALASPLSLGCAYYMGICAAATTAVSDPSDRGKYRVPVEESAQ